MYAHHEATGARTAPSWLVIDARYPFKGMLPGQPFPRPMLASGFVKKAGTLREPAGLTGLGPDRLARTVERFNSRAHEGKGPDFGRGESAYDNYTATPPSPTPTWLPWASRPTTRSPSSPATSAPRAAC